MKKKVIGLMVACLSLFAYPYRLSAGNEFAGKERTAVVIPPVSALMEKKVDALKRATRIFSKKIMFPKKRK